MDCLLKPSRPFLGLLIASASVAAALPAAAAGDAARGKAFFGAQCSSCHSVKRGETILGPSLFGIVGRRAGSVKGFAYSKAMKATSWTWTDARLRTYLPSPKHVVPGTKMSFSGVKDPARVDDLIAYLDTLK